MIMQLMCRREGSLEENGLEVYLTTASVVVVRIVGGSMDILMLRSQLHWGYGDLRISKLVETTTEQETV